MSFSSAALANNGAKSLKPEVQAEADQKGSFFALCLPIQVNAHSFASVWLLYPP
jgi:hypothetical protein